MKTYEDINYRMRIALIGLVTLLLYVAEIAAQTPSCQFVDNQGNQYDLSPLQNNMNDYFQNFPTQKWDVWINVCRATLTNLCGAGSAACQQWDPNSPTGKATLGLQKTMVLSNIQKPSTKSPYGVTAQFTQGGDGRAFEIDFQCNPGGGIGIFGFLNEDPKKHYNFAWPTEYACPLNVNVSHGLTGGSILLIILLVLVVVYLVGGILFNKFKRQATGLELIPNFEFWASIPGLVKDGCQFVINKTIRRGSYQQV